MKVLLKSLKELEEEYGIEKRDGYLIIDNTVVGLIADNTVVASDMFELFGKVVEARYDKKSDSYVVNDYWLHSNLIKGIVINEETKYTIKRLSDGIEYDFIVVK